MYIKKNKETGKKKTKKKLLCDLLVSDFVAAKYVNHPLHPTGNRPQICLD